MSATKATESTKPAPKAGFDFSKGVPATIDVTFVVPTLPGGPEFTHRLRRRASGVEFTEFLERLTSDAIGAAEPAEREQRRHEAEAYVYGCLMTDDVGGCGVVGYGEADSMSPSACVDFFTKGPNGADSDTVHELRRHIGYAISGWLRAKTSDGSFR